MQRRTTGVNTAGESETYRTLVARFEERAAAIRSSGGAALASREHERGKLTARERISRLVDPGESFTEFGLFAGDGLHDDHGGCPAGGTIAGIGRIEGRLCVILANDAGVKAGAWFPITTKKNLRAQDFALENHIPIIYLVDSAGVYLPMQDEIFPDRDHFGRIFRNNAVLSARGIPQIAAIMGSCVAGGAYLPIMSDEALIVDGTGSVYLAGPYLVKAAIGEEVDSETLGGSRTHSEISGVTDYRMPDDETCLATLRQLVSHLSEKPRARFSRTEAADPELDAESLLDIVSPDGTKPYDMMEVVRRIIDGGSWTAYKHGYGQTLLTGYARVDGWSVGVVANQRSIVRTGSGEMQVGGVIYSDAADKAARFIMNCNQKRVPLVFLQDVTGFMVGTRAEQGGIIKDGAKMVNAVANSVVPKFTIVVGNSFGAGNYAMCGRAYDPRLICAWPGARIAVMGGAQAAKTLLQIQVRAMEKKGKRLSDESRQALLASIEEAYAHQTESYYAGARLWVDEIIDPRETRTWIALGIEMADHNPDLPAFTPGVIQT